MLYKLSKESRVYGLLTLLLVVSMAAVPTAANAQEKACVISDSGKKVCGKLVKDGDEAQTNISSQSIVTVSYPGSMVANVQLLKCSRKSSVVSCKFSVNMTDKERGGGYSMDFYSASGTKISQATDNRGEDYIADKVIIGKSESKTYLSSPMVKDQPISITVSFKIPPDINTIKTLSFLTGNEYKYNAASFSNINISR